MFEVLHYFIYFLKYNIYFYQYFRHVTMPALCNINYSSFKCHRYYYALQGNTRDGRLYPLLIHLRVEHFKAIFAGQFAISSSVCCIFSTVTTAVSARNELQFNDKTAIVICLRKKILPEVLSYSRERAINTHSFMTIL